MQPTLIETLHRSEGVKLRRFLLRMLGSADAAADAHQETYLRMLGALSRTTVEHPSAFLFQIANPEETIREVASGGWTGGVRDFGLAEDGVGWVYDEHRSMLRHPGSMRASTTYFDSTSSNAPGSAV